MAVFWVAAPCFLTEVYLRFRGAYCLHHQGDHTCKTSIKFYQTTRRGQNLRSYEQVVLWACTVYFRMMYRVNRERLVSWLYWYYRPWIFLGETCLCTRHDVLLPWSRRLRPSTTPSRSWLTSVWPRCPLPHTRWECGPRSSSPRLTASTTRSGRRSPTSPPRTTSTLAPWW
jgi:hypothetical protein